LEGLSFRVTLRSKPVYAAASLHPFIDVGFALQPLDVPNFRSGTVCINLPIAFGNSLRLENDSDTWGFAHEAEYDPPSLGRKPYSDLPSV
jgi:hypothetical protein